MSGSSEINFLSLVTMRDPEHYAPDVTYEFRNGRKFYNKPSFEAVTLLVDTDTGLRLDTEGDILRVG